MYSNQAYIMLQLLNYSKTIQKHIDIKDINVSMINHSYIKIQLLIYTNILYTLIRYSKYIICNIYSESLLYNHTFCL